MKKIAFVFALLFVSAVGYAQEFYVRAGLGYAFPQAGQTVYDTPIPYYEFASAYNGTRTYNANGTQTYNIKPSSFSSGLQSALGIGYMFTPNIGIQLDASIGLSNTKYSFNDENIPLIVSQTSTPVTITSPSGTYTTTLTTNITSPYNVNTVQQAKTPVLIMPSLVLQTGGEKINAYTRFGVVLPLNTKITQDQILSNAAGTGSLSVDDFTWNIKSSFSLGFTAAAGVKYKISDKVSIWGELSLLSMSLNTKEQDLKSWTEDGQSVPLVNYPYAQNIKFSKTATVDTTFSQLPTYAQPFSNIGINFGVAFTLSHHESKRKGGDDYIDRTKPFKRSSN